MQLRKEGSPSSQDEQAVRQEWRNLCFTLERVQGDDLIANCRDKYQFARTYLVYGRHMQQTLAEVRQQAGHGDYRFFTERGIRRDVMTPDLADRMLKDWEGAIASKRARVAEAFQYRFGEEIDVFIAMTRNAAGLAAVASLDAEDAIPQLARWARP